MVIAVSVSSEPVRRGKRVELISWTLDTLLIEIGIVRWRALCLLWFLKLGLALSLSML